MRVGAGDPNRGFSLGPVAGLLLYFCSPPMSATTRLPLSMVAVAQRCVVRAV
jgi:hypothetical protein